MILNRYPIDSDVKFKVVIVGDTNVGKSCIIRRFGCSTFVNDIQSTVGVDYLEKVVSYDNSECKLQIVNSN
jgi:small GTP-binding protein